MMGEWRFYHDVSGAWQWSQLAADGTTVKESASAFTTLDQCLADAQRNGMHSTHIVRFPGAPPRPLDKIKSPPK
jgi:hypothetical protein